MGLFKCKHKWKSQIDMKIIDYAKLPFKDKNGEDIIVNSGEFNVYRCQDCKCLVWEESNG